MNILYSSQMCAELCSITKCNQNIRWPQTKRIDVLNGIYIKNISCLSNLSHQNSDQVKAMC